MRSFHLAVYVAVALVSAPAPGSATPLFVSLGHLQPRAASADGSVVVGTLGNRAVRWMQAGGAQFLTDPTGVEPTDAWGVSADGSVIAGTANSPSGSFRWTEAGGAMDLGGIPGVPIQRTTALGVSADFRPSAGRRQKG